VESFSRVTRAALWAEDLERSVEDVSGEPAHIVDALCHPIAREQLERRRRSEPLTHRQLAQPSGISAAATNGPGRLPSQHDEAVPHALAELFGIPMLTCDADDRYVRLVRR
jgi:hypothetical protein